MEGRFRATGMWLLIGLLSLRASATPVYGQGQAPSHAVSVEVAEMLVLHLPVIQEALEGGRVVFDDRVLSTSKNQPSAMVPSRRTASHKAAIAQALHATRGRYEELATCHGEGTECFLPAGLKLVHVAEAIFKGDTTEVTVLIYKGVGHAIRGTPGVDSYTFYVTWVRGRPTVLPESVRGWT